MRPAVLLSTLALGLASGGLAACGGDSGSTAGLIPTSDAGQLETAIQRVQGAVEAGDCSLSSERASQASARVDALPSSVDAALISRLRSGISRLQDQAATDCQGTRTTVPETTTTPLTVPAETVPEVTTPTVATAESVPTEPTIPATPTVETPTTPTPTPTPTPTTDTPTPDPTPPDDGGGDGGTGGIAPAF